MIFCLLWLISNKCVVLVVCSWPSILKYNNNDQYWSQHLIHATTIHYQWHGLSQLLTWIQNLILFINNLPRMLSMDSMEERTKTYTFYSCVEFLRYKLSTSLVKLVYYETRRIISPHYFFLYKNSLEAWIPIWLKVVDKACGFGMYIYIYTCRGLYFFPLKWTDTHTMNIYKQVIN